MTTARVRHVSDVPALGSITVYDDATARTADDTLLTRHELHRLHHAVEPVLGPEAGAGQHADGIGIQGSFLACGFPVPGCGLPDDQSGDDSHKGKADTCNDFFLHNFCLPSVFI